MLAASTARAQPVAWNAPLLRIADSIRIDPKKEQLLGDLRLAFRGDGTLAILGYGGQLTYYDSTGKRRWRRELGREMRWATGINWRGDSLFVIDNAGDEALAVGANGGVGAFIEFPDFVRPQFKDRRTMPAYGAIDVAAVIDSSLVGSARRAHSMGMYGTKSTSDPVVLPIVRIDYDGIVQNRIATVRNEPKGDNWSILQDGRVVILHPVGDSVALISISSRGDTVFSRKLPKPRGIIASVGGPDGTIWVTATAGGRELTHTAFDARGNPIGKLVLPSSQRIAAGSARQVWAYEIKGQAKMFTRYSLRP
jgi:hypothetical protein